MPDLKFAHLNNRAILRLTGADTKDFLQNLISNDLEPLSETNAIYSALLTPQGKFLHDFFVIEWKGSIYLDCDVTRIQDLIKRLTMYKLRSDVTIEDVTDSYQTYALFGSSDDQISARDNVLIYRDPRLTDLGWRTLSEKSVELGIPAQEVPLTEYELLRLKLGVPSSGLDILPEKNFLLEANFDDLNGVSFSKGCYVGQELTARTKFRAKIKKRLFTFTYDGDIQPGESIKLNDKEIASVTSFSKPHGIAMTRLKEWQQLETENLSVTPSGLKLHKPDYLSLQETEAE